MRGARAQADRKFYRRAAAELLAETPDLDIVEGAAEIYRRAGRMASTDAAPIDIPVRDRDRLAGSNAIASEVSVAKRTR